MQQVIIRAEQVEKYYAQPSENRIQVISPTDLSISEGEIVALLGPSGSGKSTLLRMLTGLSTPSAGQVYWHEKPVANADVNVAIVFQSFALFPWLTVVENVEAPLKARGLEPAERRKRALKMLDTVGLDGFQTAYPKELSGGMRQRVGFARALVVEPEVLFMDEPFSALDVLTAENLRSELLELWQNKTIPTRAIFIVTHNIEEAVLLADRIIVLGRNPGHVRTDFKVALAHPRERKTAAFTQLVDYIYKVLTQPEAKPPALPLTPEGRPVRDQRQICLRSCSTIMARTISTSSPMISPSRLTICCLSSTLHSFWASLKSQKAMPSSRRPGPSLRTPRFFGKKSSFALQP